MLRSRTVMPIVTVVAMALTACAPVPQRVDAAPGGSGTFTRAITTEPSNLDPHGAVESGKSAILPYLLDTLVFRAEDNSYLPYLAESWELAPDFTSMTFKLRSGVTFHDGTPLDAQAVIATFERFQQQGTGSPYAGAIANVAAMEAPDAHTVVFRFKQPTTTFLDTVSLTYAGIISPTAVQKEGADFGLDPVGSGPFKLQEWRPGVSLTLVRNPDYAWGPSAYQNTGPAYLQTLVFKVVPDASAQLAALQSGEVDVISVTQPGQLAQIKSMDDVTITESALRGLVYLGFNCAKPPLDDPRVRQALAHAVNKPEIVATALGGLGQAAFAPLAATLPNFDAGLQQFELGYDPAQAAALLTEAGFAKGPDGTWSRDGQPLLLTLLSSTRPPNQAVATALQAELAAIGIPTEISLLESAAATEAQSKGAFDLVLWRYDASDASVLGTYLSSARIGSTNRIGYSNPQVDDLLGTALREMDPQRAHDLYFQAQQIILTEAAWQPLYLPLDLYATNNRVEGIIFGAAGRVLLDDARIATG